MSDLSMEAFNEQELDLEEFYEEELDLEEFYEEENEGERWKHRLIVELEGFAIHAALFLEDNDFDEVDYSYDSDSRNYEVTFESDHKLSSNETDIILDCVQYCSYSFNIEAY